MHSSGINVDRIHALLESRNLSARELSINADLGTRTVSTALRRGTATVSTVHGIANYLQIPASELIEPKAGLYVRQWHDDDHRDRYNWHVQQSSLYLTVNKRLDGYLFGSEEMWKWAWQDVESSGFITKDRSRDFWIWSENVVENQKKIRRDYTHLHNVVIDGDLFRRAFQYEPTFIEKFANRLSSTFSVPRGGRVIKLV